MAVTYPRVFLYSATGRVPVDLRRGLDGRLTQELVRDAERWPRTDFYVQTANLSAKSERAAASMSATIVVLPQGLDWLDRAACELVGKGQSVYIYVPARAGDTL